MDEQTKKEVFLKTFKDKHGAHSDPEDNGLTLEYLNGVQIGFNMLWDELIANGYTFNIGLRSPLT